MEKTQFKAESKRLLDMMIHSIYTHKEIFLREMISNASDATDKRYYNALHRAGGLNREELAIVIEIDKENRTITLRDKGCGMTEAELHDNLGTIAKSGSLGFKEGMESNEEIDIIGQFGVGFYSAFMVSDRVEVITKSEQSNQAYRWISDGAEGYTIEAWNKEDIGTDIIMHIKPDTEEDDYSQYLDAYELETLVKRYSDYIHYPIKMQMEHTKVLDEKDENGNPTYETEKKWEVLNTMVPIWKRPKSQITKEESDRFYMQKFNDYQAPCKMIHTNTEGAATYTALMFIPSKPPYDFYSKDYEKGLQLYASGVLIMDKCADLLPDYFAFVKGIVDSQDLSLNISREMLQHNRQLKVIAGNLEKKIRSELLSMLKNDRAAYEAFFKNFGMQLKAGVYNDYGRHKDVLADLLMFYSSKDNQLATLREYVDRMQEDQKNIYYVSGANLQQVQNMPQTERIKEKGWEVLYLLDNIDEFALKMMTEYDGKPFQSISDSAFDLDSEEEKKAAEEKAAANKMMLEFFEEALKDKVGKVKLSNHLKNHPVCLTAEGEISLEMERILNAMPGNEGMPVKAKRVLELNSDHAVFGTLVRLFAEDQDKAKRYIQILYTQALLIEGFPIENAVEYCNNICELMI